MESYKQTQRESSSSRRQTAEGDREIERDKETVLQTDRRVVSVDVHGDVDADVQEGVNVEVDV